MSRRRGTTAIASNPVLVGVATTLVVVVAVFLAYNANAGLPWIPSYRLTAEVPSAANLVKGNEVRIGGLRVGVIDDITPVKRPDGHVIARLSLKLETRVKPIPSDSTLMIRPRSALGLKYVEVTRGKSKTGFQEGGLIPLKNATPLPVDIDQFYNMFDPRTRSGIRGNQEGFGGGFAGRGQDLNSAIHTFVPLVRNATKALRNIADPKTRFNRFFASQGRTAAIVAPIAVTQAELWGNLDATFRAWATVARPFLQQTISKGPGGLQTATEDFPKIRPLLRNTQVFFATLRPGAAALRKSAPDLAVAVHTGVHALARAPNLNRKLGDFFVALQTFSQDPFVPLGFRDLFTTVSTLDPLVGFVTPAQTVCNYANLWFNNVAGLLSEGDSKGNWGRFVVMTGPSNAPPNSLWGPAGAPAAGGGSPISGKDPNYLHSNPYPNTASPGQPNECEAGNEDYKPEFQATIGNPAGTQSTKTQVPSEDAKKSEATK